MPFFNITVFLYKLVTHSLHLANAGSGGFSFDCPIGQSIGELSPCVPRFCYYERNCFVSTQFRTKSTFFGGNQEIFLSVSSSTPDILKPFLLLSADYIITQEHLFVYVFQNICSSIFVFIYVHRYVQF